LAVLIPIDDPALVKDLVDDVVERGVHSELGFEFEGFEV
jgi:hypothetical protein